MRRGLAAGGLLAAAVAAYSIAALAVRPGFYDGIAPQSPYNWVSPPPIFAANNKPPQSGSGSVRVGPGGQVDPGTIFTGDGQAQLSFVAGAFTAPADHSAVRFTITPVATFPTPGGIKLATNVYCYTSSQPLAAGKDALVTLRYSDQVTSPGDIYGYQDVGPWARLGSTGTAAPYHVSTRSTFIGCFAGGYPANASSSAGGARIGGGQLLPILVAAAILIVVLAGVPLALVRRRREEE